MLNKGFMGLVNFEFPAPREVDRELYWEGHGFYLAPQMFPAPLEVDR